MAPRGNDVDKMAAPISIWSKLSPWTFLRGSSASDDPANMLKTFQPQADLHTLCMEDYILPLLSQIQQHAGWQPVVTVVSATAIAVLSWRLLSSKREPQALPFYIPVPYICNEGWWDTHDALEEPKKRHEPLGYGDEEPPEDEIPCVCPADGRPLGTLGTFKAQDKDWIDTAVRRCTNAQPKWAETTFAQRRQVLRTLLNYVLNHQEDIVTACCLDSGKTRLDAYFGEVLVTVEKLKWTIEHGEKALRPSKRPTNFLMFYKDNEVRYEPLGVVAACVSWNYPFHNFISPIISAIFAGNAIVIKPSEQVAWSSIYFTNIAKGAIAACGHSHNIVQTVVCLPKDADHLTSHPGISHITFIGSREVAHKVCASAAKSLTPVTVELGGKDPAIILDDKKTVANLEEIASILMRGVFQNAGQNCIGIERVIALPGVYSKLIDIIKPRIQNLKIGSVMLDERWSFGETDAVKKGQYGDLDELNAPQTSDENTNPDDKDESSPPHRSATIEDDDEDEEGDYVPIPSPPSNTTTPPKTSSQPRTSSQQSQSLSPFASLDPSLRPHLDLSLPSATDLGAMISAKSFPRLTQLISSALSSGALLHHGGTPFPHPRYPQGTYFTPTLLTSVSPSMPIAQTELFAPIFLLMRAETVSEAIDIANSVPYALGASVFGYSRPDVETVVHDVKAGMVSVNDFAAYYACSLPFGGIKGSGYGRFGGEEGLRALCNVKAVCRDKWPGLVETRIPALLDMPAPKVGSAEMGGSLRAAEMVQGVIEVGYAIKLSGRVAGVIRIVRAVSERFQYCHGKVAAGWTWLSTKKGNKSAGPEPAAAVVDDDDEPEEEEEVAEYDDDE